MPLIVTVPVPLLVTVAPVLPATMFNTPSPTDTVAVTLGRYAWLLLWPHPLTSDYYPYHVTPAAWTEPRAFLPAALYLGLAAAALAGLRRRSVVAFAAFAYLAALSVVSNAFFPVGTFMSERFLYAPSLGFALGLGWALGAWRPGGPQRGPPPRGSAG